MDSCLDYWLLLVDHGVLMVGVDCCWLRLAAVGGRWSPLVAVG